MEDFDAMRDAELNRYLDRKLQDVDIEECANDTQAEREYELEKDN